MKKTLHHYSKINTYQFITYRTNDSVDDFIYRMKNNPSISVSKMQYNIDKHLDNSIKGTHLNGQIISSLIEYCKSLEPKFYKLIALTVMPNHIHILLKQNLELGLILQKLKGGSSLFINKILHKKGQFWERDYFDVAIKDEKHYQSTYNYIKNNAVNANLSDWDLRFYGTYEE